MSHNEGTPIPRLGIWESITGISHVQDETLIMS